MKDSPSRGIDACGNAEPCFAELTLPRRKSSLDLDPEQQLADVHLQDTVDQDELQEDAEHGDEEATSPEEAAGTVGASAGAAPGGTPPLLVLLGLCWSRWSRH